MQNQLIQHLFLEFKFNVIIELRFTPTHPGGGAEMITGKNGHHQTAALIERGQSLWIYDLYEYHGPDDFEIFREVKGAVLANGYILDGYQFQDVSHWQEGG